MLILLQFAFLYQNEWLVENDNNFNKNIHTHTLNHPGHQTVFPLR